MSNPSEPLPEIGFDPLLFWDEHKQKVLLYGALLVVALIGYALYQVNANRRIAAAEAMFAEADTADEYQRVAEKFPRTVPGGDAQLALGGALREQKKHDESAAALRKFVEQYPEHPLISSGWISLASTLEQQGKDDEALDVYRQVATKYPTSHDAPLAMISQAKILRNKGKIDDARKTYEGVMAQFPESYYSRFAMHEMQMFKGAAKAAAPVK